MCICQDPEEDLAEAVSEEAALAAAAEAALVEDLEGAAIVAARTSDFIIVLFITGTIITAPAAVWAV